MIRRFFGIAFGDSFFYWILIMSLSDYVTSLASSVYGT